MSKIKNHLQKHKVFYVSATCFFGGVGVGFLCARIITPEVTQKALALWKAAIDRPPVQTTINSAGNSGNIVQDLITGRIYPSQNAAAKGLDVSTSTVSKHLSGKVQDSNGAGRLTKLLDGGAPVRLNTSQ